MTPLTRRFRVFTFQLENRQIVVELCGRPPIFGMAVHATESIFALMGLIVAMAGIAILQRHLKIPKSARIDMTLHARKPFMFTGDLEGIFIVIEIRNQTIHTVVTIQAGWAKG